MLAMVTSSDSRRRQQRVPVISPSATPTTRRARETSRFHVDAVVRSNITTTQSHASATKLSDVSTTTDTGRSCFKTSIFKFKIRNFFFIVIGCASALLIAWVHVSAQNVIPSNTSQEFDQHPTTKLKPNEDSKPNAKGDPLSKKQEFKSNSRNLSSKNRFSTLGAQPKSTTTTTTTGQDAVTSSVTRDGAETSFIKEGQPEELQQHRSWQQESDRPNLRQQPRRRQHEQQKQQKQQQKINERQPPIRAWKEPRGSEDQPQRQQQQRRRQRRSEFADDSNHQQLLQSDRPMEGDFVQQEPDPRSASYRARERRDRSNQFNEQPPSDDRQQEIDGRTEMPKREMEQLGKQQQPQGSMRGQNWQYPSPNSPHDEFDHVPQQRSKQVAFRKGSKHNSLQEDEQRSQGEAEEEIEPAQAENVSVKLEEEMEDSLQEGIEESQKLHRTRKGPSYYSDMNQQVVADRLGQGPAAGAATSNQQQQEDFSSSQKLTCSNLDQSHVDRMMYWKPTRETDFDVVTAYRQIRGAQAKYLTFELNATNIQWNSRRRLLETMIALAFATGRTLVLPPKMTLISSMEEMGKAGMTPWLGFQDLLTLPSPRYKGISVITMDKFLELEGTTGRLKTTPKLNRNGGTPLSPPNGYAHWDGAANLQDLWNYLQSVSYEPEDWNPQTCVLGIPSVVKQSSFTNQDNDEEAARDLELSSMVTVVDNGAFSTWMENIWGKHHGRPPPDKLDYQGRPTRVDAPAVERLRELVADRKKMCYYGQDVQQAKVLHIRGDPLENSIPFYSFVFFEDWKQDLVVKRLIRDQVRYRDDIVCAAAQVVDHLQVADGGGLPAQFHGIHLLLRDLIKDDTTHFEEDDLNIAMTQFVEDLRKWIQPASRLYVATDMDEQRDCFQILRQTYHLVFVSYIESLLQGQPIQPVFYPMVEQLVLAKSHTFVGSYPSTFSAYVNRLRGYYSTSKGPSNPNNNHLDILQQAMFDDGSLVSYYLTPRPMQKQMRLYQALKKPLGDLEYPVSWRDIDK